jgi:hypothetical protein
VVHYNLACYYALAGAAGQAIEALRDALKLHPDLSGWSREDTDLNSLHGNPDYEQLYAG